MKTKLLISLLLLLSVGAAAQTSRKELDADPNRAGVTYFAYPGPVQQALTPAPAGYEPFYISHYGRHGSRYMTENDPYVLAIGKLDTAAQMGILTPKGAEVLEKLRLAYADAWKRDGDLSKLGGRQHREIAHRMYERFPQLLSRPMSVDARSSTVGRCMISMFYFCQELQGLNPELKIRMDASKRDMPFVVSNERVKPKPTPEMGAYQQRFATLLEKAEQSDRFMKSLFTDREKARELVACADLMAALYNVALDLQNLPELNLSLMDVFTRDELYGAYDVSNTGTLLYLGLLPGAMPAYQRQLLVRDSIVSVADRVIRTGQPTLTLRFSHDSALIPLAYLMGLKEAMGGRADLQNLHRYISVDKLCPMAANIQLVFYRKEGSDDILVKFLLNENETSIPVKTDVAPYYHWQDVKSFWEGHPAPVN